MLLHDLQVIADNFTKELQESSHGQKTSLPFIINELPSQPLVQEGETFQVIGLGGSVFRTALITKSGGELEVKNPVERSHPIFKTKQILLDFIAENLYPDTKYLAINFAQALDPVFENGKLDGRLVGQAKEHKFDGLFGEKVCSAIEEHVRQETGREIKASIGNDTICLMLSGLTRYPAESLAAGIVGTGMNFAIFLDKTHAINLEAAEFTGFVPDLQTQAIDTNSEKPGFHVWEKAVSGAYLYMHFNLLLRARSIRYPEISDTKELDTVVRQGIPEVSEIAKEVITNSAQMVGAMMAGIVNFYGRDITFVMQGSLFWHGFEYKETVARTIESLSSHRAEFAYVESADYLGAAKLIA